MRGEHVPPYAIASKGKGSSPHARGAPLVDAHIWGFPGIIPACAGSTLATSPCSRCRRDHPRMRGEHSAPSLPPFTHRGSSPHARGARRGEPRRLDVAGIIPACAGSTSRNHPLRQAGRDHPRMRGEHSCTSIEGHQNEGSSPHARGAQPRRPDALAQAGIIPACAGSTLMGSLTTKAAWDHPRMRGEHFLTKMLRNFNTGSSPHARGAPRRLAYRDVSGGIIPACAGSTLKNPSSRYHTV